MARTHKIDPDGDVTIFLQQPDLQELRWPSDTEVSEESVPEPEPEPEGSSASAPVDEVANVDEDADDAVQFLVSSRHLCLASSVFQKMLRGPWAESEGRNGDGTREIEIVATEWDTEALLIVLNIIHGRNRSVPRPVSLEMLANIAAIVDYYDCHEAVEVFVDLWIPLLESTIPTSYGIDCVLWLCISSVFSQDNTLRKMVELAIMDSTEPILAMGLPIPVRLLGKQSTALKTAYLLHVLIYTGIDAIEESKKELIAKILQMLDDLVESLTTEADCGYQCQSILLGHLLRGMRAADIPKPGCISKPISVNWLRVTVLGMQTSCHIHSQQDFYGHSHYNHGTKCNLQARVKPALDVILATVNDIEI